MFKLLKSLFRKNKTTFKPCLMELEKAPFLQFPLGERPTLNNCYFSDGKSPNLALLNNYRGDCENPALLNNYRGSLAAYMPKDTSILWRTARERQYIEATVQRYCEEQRQKSFENQENAV